MKMFWLVDAIYSFKKSLKFFKNKQINFKMTLHQV